MADVIRVTDLCKSFTKGINAVDGLSFSVQSGKVYGFLGQNGAGKSTTIRMLLTLIRPTSGAIEMFGLDLARHRKEILRNTGAIIERPDLYKYLTALENLRIFAAMSGLSPSTRKMMDQLEMVGLAERAHGKVRTYSQGMKQRLGIATALIHDPDLIILDEPTNGLDPQGIADMRKLILHLSKDLSKTVLVSSHLLSEMEQVADSMLIIDRGKKIAEGRMEELFNPDETIVEVVVTDPAGIRQQLAETSLTGSIRAINDNMLQLKLHRDQLSSALRELIDAGVEVQAFQSRNSLEDYFLSITTGAQHVQV